MTTTMLEYCGRLETCAGCGEAWPFNGYCDTCLRLAIDFNTREPKYGPAETYRRMVRRSFFDGLPGRDGGIEYRKENMSKLKHRAVTVSLLMASTVVFILAAIGATDVVRYLVR